MTQSEAYLYTIDKVLARIFNDDDAPISLMESVVNEMPNCLWKEMVDVFGYKFSEDCRDEFCPVYGHTQSGSGDIYVSLRGQEVAGPCSNDAEALGAALEHLQDNADTIDVLEWLAKRLATFRAEQSAKAFNSMTGNPIAALNTLTIRG
ncbi:MAG: hypothetical protein E6R03_12610 [Hyphomicrobiaceae bacterium]|nr:MAG: hypothetical protein E6R03_12610 [Hyphomicrobiaceae bacterium]